MQPKTTELKFKNLYTFSLIDNISYLFLPLRDGEHLALHDNYFTYLEKRNGPLCLFFKLNNPKCIIYFMYMV